MTESCPERGRVTAREEKRVKKLVSIFITVAALASGIAAAKPAAKRETRCGWFDNPTPANATLTDADGEWLISEQGGYQAEGDWPPTDKSWVHTNGGSYG